MGVTEEKRLHRVRGSPREADWPETCRVREAPLVEKPFESPPPPPRSPAAAGGQLEGNGAGPANFKPAACPSLPAPRNRLVHSTGKGPFPDGRPYLFPLLSALSPPQASLSGALGFRARTPGGSLLPLPTSLHRVVQKKIELVGVPSPCS